MMPAAYERAIDTDNVTKAIASFQRDRERRASYGSLLAYLLSADRPADAKLLLDVPRQVTSKVLETAFQKLSHDRAASWSLVLFEQVLARRPPLYVPEGETPISLFFGAFSADSEARAVRAAKLLVDAYGVHGKLAHGRTMLHAVAAGAIHDAVLVVLDAGASKTDLDDFGDNPFSSLLGSSSLDRVTPETLTLLATEPFPNVPALTGFLDDPEGTRPIDEVVAVLEMLIGLGAPAGPFDGEKSPLEAVLLMQRPEAERDKLVDVLVRSNKTGSTFSEALPGVVQAFRVEQLRYAIMRAGARPGDTHGPERYTLLHHACASLADYGDGDDDFVGARVVPTLEFLCAFGEDPNARDRRGKTPIDIARRKKKEFEADAWKRIEAVLATGSRTSDRKRSANSGTFGAVFPDPAFSIGVLGALLAVKGRRRGRAIDGAIGEVDCVEESAREAAALHALHDLPVGSDELASVASLTFAVDDPVYLRLADGTSVDHGGESSDLRVQSIAGIGVLSSLRLLDLAMYGADVTLLSPLEGHAAIREIILEGRVEDPEVLLTLPSLERVRCRNVDVVLGDVVARLRAKGVDVRSAVGKRVAAKKPAAKKPAAKKPAAKKPAAKKPAAKKPA